MSESFAELEERRQAGLQRLRELADARSQRMNWEQRRLERERMAQEQAARDAASDDWAWLKGGVTGLATGAGTGASVGGPWGALIGGVAGFGLGAAGGALSQEANDPSLMAMTPAVIQGAGALTGAGLEAAGYGMRRDGTFGSLPGAGQGQQVKVDPYRGIAVGVDPNRIGEADPRAAQERSLETFEDQSARLRDKMKKYDVNDPKWQQRHGIIE